METIHIQNRVYTFVRDYFENSKLFGAFNVLAKSVFDFELENWDDPNYTCYSLMDNDTMAANLAVQSMAFEYEGEWFRAAQILTVMTAESYRKKGLISWLLDRIIPQLENEFDLVYLFANDNAVDIYPRFGFEKDYEFYHFTNQVPAKNNLKVRKLDLSDSKDNGAYENALVRGFACTAFPAFDADGIIRWLSEEIYSDQLWYIADLKVAVVYCHEESTLKLHSVFGAPETDLNDVVAALVNSSTKRVELGFTPMNADLFQLEKLQVEGSTLQVLHKKEWFELKKIRIPQLVRT